METAAKPNHIGRKIGRIRELRGMKQETLAEELGISQQAVSKIEQSEHIEDDKLNQIAKVLGVTKEGIENFSDENILNIISNTFTSNDNSTINAINVQPNFNPLDKVIELYERLLKSEQEKIAYLEKLMKEK
ncbi:helix-turn-helix transcriptional regulator [Maribacter polysiphoniae]|uniref:DNA-binding XRE family transcriptional regulator n=1 Tax=Maribacter polysiphoniae TaxID=429344 RepID=A0A316DIU3_9FLAO|nr:helix-turn-helix transcriptional regulator [Maribacter polysiphoniae]MBD1263059.1 helix-turn-helix transcriptional regulator [Maribacter polysiphoniae]PWK17159.1 DNA-binding XRE family transcriptional regulator [Maribacter polysiphoniae]